jgi:hypothetical protein
MLYALDKGFLINSTVSFIVLCMKIQQIHSTASAILPHPELMRLLSSATSLNNYQITRCHIPEESYLHIHSRENLKSHI